jgi:hypothetical protein
MHAPLFVCAPSPPQLVRALPTHTCPLAYMHPPSFVRAFLDVCMPSQICTGSPWIHACISWIYSSIFEA